MIRQSLDTDAAFADVALHGDGLTSLQFRAEKGAVTHEIESNVPAPKRLRIEKRGDSFTMWLGGEDGVFHFAGGSTVVPLQGPFYVGIGVCAHNKDEFRKAVFSGVELTTPSQAGDPAQWSTLETITVASTDARVAYAAPGRIESPSWSADSLSLFFHRDGRIGRVAVAGGAPEMRGGVAGRIAEPPGSLAQIPVDEFMNGFAHVSPDGRRIAFLSWKDEGSDMLLRVFSLDDRKVTTLCRFSGGPRSMDVPSWSPDGRRLAFVSYQRIR
jgi:hypothetical protein